jgi:hypothetical protein
MANLSAPTIVTLHDLTNNPAFTSALTTFIVNVFDNQTRDPELFDLSILRFDSPKELLDELGASGIMCVIFDRDEEGPSIGDGKGGRIVACVGAIPWDGSDEGGWELKTVCVDWHEKYAKKRLAIRTVECLGRYLAKLPTEEVNPKSVTDSMGGMRDASVDSRTLTLWIRTEECLNGEYWRRRGFTEIQRTAISGIWAIKTGVSIEMAILRKDLSF